MVFFNEISKVLKQMIKCASVHMVSDVQFKCARDLLAYKSNLFSYFPLFSYPGKLCIEQTLSFWVCSISINKISRECSCRTLQSGYKPYRFLINVQLCLHGNGRVTLLIEFRVINTCYRLPWFLLCIKPNLYS